MDMTKLKTGQAATAAARKGGFLSNIYWKEDKEARFLLFLTPYDEVPGLPIHMYETANGWRTFVCRKAAIFEDESQGQCDICALQNPKRDRDPAKPNYKQIALAVELEPKYERVEGRERLVGFDLLLDEWEKDGETKSAPAIGLVSQAPSNFWVPLASTVDRKGDITEYVIEVERKGKGKNAKVSYTFFDHQGFLEEIQAQLEEHVPEEGWLKKLHNWIAEHGDQARYEEELSGVTRDDSDDAEPESSDGDEAAESSAASKFEELRANLEAKEKGDTPE